MLDSIYGVIRPRPISCPLFKVRNWQFKWIELKLDFFLNEIIVYSLRGSWLILRKWQFSINASFFCRNIFLFRNALIVWFYVSPASKMKMCPKRIGLFARTHFMHYIFCILVHFCSQIVSIKNWISCQDFLQERRITCTLFAIKSDQVVSYSADRPFLISNRIVWQENHMKPFIELNWTNFIH